MGYTTDFNGEFEVTPKLDEETRVFLQKLSNTRRMKRMLPEEYGIDGEFFVDGKGHAGQDRDDSILNYNEPPRTQPSLWCQWEPNEDGTAIRWDGGEKFYNYVEWIKYIINKVLEPRGYKLNGEVEWYGEDSEDMGKINIVNNNVKVKVAKVTYEYEDED